MEKVSIHTEQIQLDQFLKLAGAVETGGAVKPLLLEGCIIVNGVKETARRKKLFSGDIVKLKTDDGDFEYQVTR
ncbi:MAG: RNA-binding S4 domain-containing protein [Lachnospiraceae bacterium]|nr:RNA-binding S4 domain-containing protein [Lachnospiraceae bacterium]